MFTGIYDTLVYALYPLVIKGYINKRKKNGKEDLTRFNERIGIAKKDRPQGKLIWMHGASVGESLSIDYPPAGNLSGIKHYGHKRHNHFRRING